MVKYRILVSTDEKNFFWIIVNNGKIINNPTKEDLIGTKSKYYNKTNICPRCREENNITGKIDNITDKQHIPDNISNNIYPTF